MVVGFDHENKITYCLVSNTHADNGELVDFPRNNFRFFLDKPKFRSDIRAVGWTIPVNVQKDLKTRLRETHRGGASHQKKR